ncbi:DUF6185 family protein [Streptomyces sp. NPDC101206]|uniref:DUF6185 family protein n=1 Tax=Streptomyces sp. NPDC101206 TaxID=3366128 RepID=UPI00382FC081
MSVWGGPGAMLASPSPNFGEKGTVLEWDHKGRYEIPTVEFAPPGAQKWNAITSSPGSNWEVLGAYSASGAVSFVAESGLLLVAARRLRQSLGSALRPKESEALGTMRSWALLQGSLGLVVYLGDDLYRFASRRMAWAGDYEPTLWFLAMPFLGVALCLFGKVRKGLLIAVSTAAVCLTALYTGAELAEVRLVPISDATMSPGGYWVSAITYLVALFTVFLGVIAAGRRALLLGGQGRPEWVAVSVSVAAAAMTVVWARLVFERFWEGWSWLADPGWPLYREERAVQYDSWWWGFPSAVMPPMLDVVSFLTLLALVGALRVCRAEQYEADSFTPNQAEKFVLMVFFAVGVVPSQAWPYGFSCYALTLLLSLLSVGSLLALGRSRSVLEQPATDNAPLGRIVSRTDRSDLLRLARHFRELQSRRQHLGSDPSSDRAAAQLAIENELDRLDRSLPEGVRPGDLPFACGPKESWWENACTGAVIACFTGIPATGVMYWVSVVRGDTWFVWTHDPSGFVSILLEILYWQTIWVAGGFFLGALWRDLPGRNGPAKAFCVTIGFALPVLAEHVISALVGQTVPGTVGIVAAFASVTTLTGLVMDVQTFESERRYWPTSAGLVSYVYQMRIASVAFFLAQVLALATIWKTFKEGGPTAPPPR